MSISGQLKRCSCWSSTSTRIATLAPLHRWLRGFNPLEYTEKVREMWWGGERGERKPERKKISRFSPSFSPLSTSNLAMPEIPLRLEASGYHAKKRIGHWGRYCGSSHSLTEKDGWGGVEKTAAVFFAVFLLKLSL